MARKRMIDPNFWQSEDVAKLTIRQRLVLIGLFSHADDYGLGRAKPAYLRAQIFPYDDINVEEIEMDLQAISKYISIEFYALEGNSYYKFTNWNKWQKVQHPGAKNIPDSKIQESFMNNSGNETISNSPNINKDNTIELKENDLIQDNHFDMLFEKFWEAYPRKQKKKEAKKQWEKLEEKNSPELVASIMVGLLKYKNCQLWKDPKYIPHAVNWLKNEQWNDEITPENGEEQKILELNHA